MRMAGDRHGHNETGSESAALISPIEEIPHILNGDPLAAPPTHRLRAERLTAVC